MKALGMIEVYGYLAAVEALDSALKAANVSLIEVKKVTGGLVAVFVTGDVGATKAAVSAAAAAAAKVGEVLSVHVIPRPAADIEKIIDGPPKKSEPATELTETPQEIPQPPAEPEQEQEAKPSVEPEQEPEQETKEMSLLTREDMDGMTVGQLRSKARELDITNMTRPEIRFAKKEELIGAILEYLKQER